MPAGKASWPPIESAECVYRGYRLCVTREDFGTGRYNQTHAWASKDPRVRALFSQFGRYDGSLSDLLSAMCAHVDYCLRCEAAGIPYR